MKKRVLLLGLVVLMVLTGCGTTEKETKTKEKDPDKLVLNIEDKKERAAWFQAAEPYKQMKK